MTQETLIEVKNLTKYFPVGGGLFRKGADVVKAVDDVSFAIRRGETFGLVGESGCGKTTLGRSILRLERPQSGQVMFQGVDVLALPPRALKQARRGLQAIFQDPLGSLDPRMKVRQLVGEGLMVQGVSRDERDARVAELIDVVGLRREH